MPPPPSFDDALRDLDAPAFLFPVFRAAGARYGVPWELLAAVNDVESDFGRNAGVSYAGAVGWMQFLPSTWRAYGVDADGDRARDPADPVDAVFSAARYLQAAGVAADPRAAVFAYNHAAWYVDEVLRRAASFGALGDATAGALARLAQMGEPTARRARAGHLDARGALVLRTRRRTRVVAVADSTVERMGVSRRRGRHLVLRTADGDRVVYAHLGALADRYLRPKAWSSPGRRGKRAPRRTKVRLYANPRRPRALAAGGRHQLERSEGPPLGRYFVGPVTVDPSALVARRLVRGARLLAGTVVGRVGRGRLTYAVRPAGRQAPFVDMRPFLAAGRTLRRAVEAPAMRQLVASGGGDSARRWLALSDRELRARVLRDARIVVYPCGRRDIARGAIDRRVLATLGVLADSGLHPTVSSLHCAHPYLTSSGNVSEHSVGSAVDIAAINGVPILGNQGPGSITEATVRRLLALPAEMTPHQIISLMTVPGAANVIAMGDHADHIHVGFHPASPRPDALSWPASADLTSAQWQHLAARLMQIRQPQVPRRPSRFALAVGSRASASVESARLRPGRATRAPRLRRP